jgi:hypothetical protein
MLTCSGRHAPGQPLVCVIAAAVIECCVTAADFKLQLAAYASGEHSLWRTSVSDCVRKAPPFAM